MRGARAAGGMAVGCLAGLMAGSASAATINFEGLPFGAPAPMNLGAAIATFTGTGGPSVANLAFQTGRPASWGNQALVSTTWTVSFSTPAFNEATIDFSYAFISSAQSGTAYYEAWSGAGATGTLLASGSMAFSGYLNGGQFGTLSIATGQGFGSLRFYDVPAGGPAGMAWDNLTLTTVPLPTASVMAMGGLGLVAVRRRLG